MADIEHWVRTARDGTIIRRATLTALLVGTILTAVNRGSESLRAGIEPGHILPIAFYLVPFVVSLASSVSATRANERRRDPAKGAARGLRDRPPYPAASASKAGPDEEIEQREMPP